MRYATARFDRARPFPTELSVAAGSLAVLLGCLTATFVFAPDASEGRLAVLAAVIAAFAATARNMVAAVATAGLAWPFYVGFLVNRFGELSWSGGTDARRLAVLMAAAVAGTAVGRLAATGAVDVPRKYRIDQRVRENEETQSHV